MRLTDFLANFSKPLLFKIDLVFDVWNMHLSFSAAADYNEPLDQKNGWMIWAKKYP